MEIDLVDDNDSVILVSGEEHRQEGTKHYKNKEYNLALNCYTAAIDTEPDVSSYYSNRSATYIMLEKYREAYTDAQKCIELDENNLKYLMRLGKCEMFLGNWNDAENTFSKIISLDSSNSEALIQRQNVEKCRSSHDQYQQQLERQDFRHALFCLDTCLRLSPDADELQLQKVGLFVSLKRYVEAKAYLETLIQRSGSAHVKTEALFYRGLIFYYLDHADKASEHLQHVLRQNPDHVAAQKAYKRCKRLQQLREEGNRLVQNREFERARLAYTSALEMDSEHDVFNARLYCNRALVYIRLGRPKEALEDCDVAIKLDPAYEKPICRRVSCLMELEQWQDAVREAERLLSRSSVSGSHEELSRLVKEAKRGLKRAGQLNPYAILGITKHATDIEIKKAYKKQSLAHHPDRHPNETDEGRKMHEKKFKEVGTAYSVLSDAKKKRMYDSGADIDDVLGNGGGGGGGFGDEKAHEMFQAFFGGGRTTGNHCSYQFS